jgi:hypothetical protein
MKRVAVTTVRDEGAAQVAKETLAELGIEVELRRQAINPYFGAATADVFEVRVPEDRLVEAEHALARLEKEVEEALIAAAGASVAEAEPPKPTVERNRLTAPAIFMIAMIALLALAYIYMESRHAVEP